MGRADRRKTSFEVDFAKVDVARGLLGTSTLTDTVDAALSEVAKLDDRRRLVDLLLDSDEYELGDPEVSEAAWR